MRIIDWSSDVCSSDLGAGASLVERTLVDATGAVAHHPRQGDHLTYRARLRFHHDVDSPQVLFYVLAEDGTLAYEMKTAIGRRHRGYRSGEEAIVEIGFEARLGGGTERKSVGEGKRVTGRVDPGGGPNMKK